MVHIGNDWDELLNGEFQSENYQKIQSILKEEYRTHVVYPPTDAIFNAFKLTPYSAVKVVILGQDPYHEENQANGLSFSVQNGVPLPPSLKNIFKELQLDLSLPTPTTSDLSHWAKQGVLLLNSTLTVRAHMANSHSKIGWTQFTDNVIRLLNFKNTPIVFILWGGFAISKKSLIDTTFHHVIESPHPSPLAAYKGFFGSKPFSKCNALLYKNGIAIDWKL